MMIVNENPIRHQDGHTGVGTLIFRGMIALNVILIALSWLPWFAGTDKKLGAADRLLGAFRLGGFRADFVWLFFSTIAVSFALLAFLPLLRKDRSARVNACCCVLQIIAFTAYLYHALVSGLLYFG